MVPDVIASIYKIFHYTLKKTKNEESKIKEATVLNFVHSLMPEYFLNLLFWHLFHLYFFDSLVLMNINLPR